MSFAIIMGILSAYTAFSGLVMAHAVNPELSFNNPVQTLGDRIAVHGSNSSR